MSDKFEIRKIQEGDREAFISMSRDFYASDAVLHNVPDEYHHRAFAELMRSEDYARCYVFIREGSIAGYALLSVSYSREAGGSCIWIEEIYLRPELRGRGAAHVFFRWLEKNIPAARYRLETEQDNFKAKKLYASMGYVPLEYQQFIKGS